MVILLYIFFKIIFQNFNQVIQILIILKCHYFLFSFTLLQIQTHSISYWLFGYLVIGMNSFDLKVTDDAIPLLCYFSILTILSNYANKHQFNRFIYYYQPARERWFYITNKRVAVHDNKVTQPPLN